MEASQFFSALWSQYTAKTPSAEKVKYILEQEGNTVYNDHIAIRTFNDPRVHIDVLSKPFLNMGYVEKGEYHFETKKLYAKHYEHATDSDAPKIFISQLLLEHFSSDLRQTIENLLDGVSDTILESPELILKGRVWDTPSYSIYKNLLEESEYAGWMYVNGFCSNHFTIDVNKLETFDDLLSVNSFLKNNGFSMNASGGEIKGSASQLLEQSSILADTVDVTFKEEVKKITSCYYEFAYRYPKADGELFTGFIAGSADKIFESTDMGLQETFS